MLLDLVPKRKKSACVNIPSLSLKSPNLVIFYTNGASILVKMRVSYVSALLGLLKTATEGKLSFATVDVSPLVGEPGGVISTYKDSTSIYAMCFQMDTDLTSTSNDLRV